MAGKSIPKEKILILGFLLIFALGNLGCTGSNGIAGLKARDETAATVTDLAGVIFLPSTVNLDLLASSRLASASNGIDRGAKSARAFVNGKEYPIVINPGSNTFTISEVEGSGGLYNIEILMGKIILKAQTGSTDNITLDSQTTAAALIAGKLNTSAIGLLASFPGDISAFAKTLETVFKADTASFTGSVFEIPEISAGLASAVQIIKAGGSKTTGGIGSGTMNTNNGSETGVLVRIPPSVSISYPADNANFLMGGAVNITAVATSTDGTVAKVEFFQGSIKLGEILEPPYDFVWQNAPVGAYQLTVRAVTNDGQLKTSDPITITVNSEPDVEITSPANGSAFSYGSDIVLTAEVSNDGGVVNNVEFFNDESKIGEAPAASFTFVWKKPGVGTYIITAKIKGPNGGVINSSSLGIVINPAVNIPPTIAITSPENYSESLVGTDLVLIASASDRDGRVSRVEFFSGSLMLFKLGEKYEAPFTFTIPNIQPGSYSFTTKAFDNFGAEKISEAVNVSIVTELTGRGNLKPEVSITTPPNGTVIPIGAQMSISANAVDSDGYIAKVEFFAGSVKIGEVGSPPYLLPWAEPDVGTHSLTVRATDDLGATAISSPVSITVKNATTTTWVSQ